MSHTVPIPLEAMVFTVFGLTSIILTEFVTFFEINSGIAVLTAVCFGLLVSMELAFLRFEKKKTMSQETSKRIVSKIRLKF